MDPTTAIATATLATSAISTLLIVARRSLPSFIEAHAKAKVLAAEERAAKARARADEAIARRAEAEERRADKELDAVQASITAGSLDAYEQRLQATERARDAAQARVAVLERELRKRGITPPGGTPKAEE